MICTVCGSKNNHKKKAKGNIIIEIILWCCYIVPGLIYSIWRISSKRLICLSCGSEALIPENSIIGKKIMEDVKPPADDGVRYWAG